MLRRSLQLLALSAAVLAGGCATVLTMEAIDPGDEEDDSDYVANVESAWRDEPGNVTLCVTGMPAGANYWLGSSRDFRIVYPGAASPSVTVLHHEAIPEYRITAADVRGRCAATMNGVTPLPVLRIHAREFGGGDYFEMSDAALSEFFEKRAEAPAVYTFDYRSGGAEFGSDLMTVVYVHEEPLHGDARAVEIATGDRKRNGSPAHVLALPFAVVYDVVTFPLQVLVALMHAG
jgi:uncharacterized protein YceK